MRLRVFIYMILAVFDIIKSPRPSQRGEMEITDVNNVYAAAGTLTHGFFTGWWIDAGTHESLFQATLFSKEGEQLMRSILVTGGMGFIGSNFIHYWKKHHPEDHIINVDLLTYAGNKDNVRSLDGQAGYQFVHGDIGNEALMNEADARGRCGCSFCGRIPCGSKHS